MEQLRSAIDLARPLQAGLPALEAAAAAASERLRRLEEEKKQKEFDADVEESLRKLRETKREKVRLQSAAEAAARAEQAAAKAKAHAEWARLNQTADAEAEAEAAANKAAEMVLGDMAASFDDDDAPPPAWASRADLRAKVAPAYAASPPLPRVELEVTLFKPQVEAKLGISLKNGILEQQLDGVPSSTQRPFVTVISKGGIAAQSGVIRETDFLLAVNDQPCDNHDQTTQQLRSAVGPISIRLSRDQELMARAPAELGAFAAASPTPAVHKKKKAMAAQEEAKKMAAELEHATALRAAEQLEHGAFEDGFSRELRKHLATLRDGLTPTHMAMIASLQQCIDQLLPEFHGAAHLMQLGSSVTGLQAVGGDLDFTILMDQPGVTEVVLPLHGQQVQAFPYLRGSPRISLITCDLPPTSPDLRCALRPLSGASPTPCSQAVRSRRAASRPRGSPPLRPS